MKNAFVGGLLFCLLLLIFPGCQKKHVGTTLPPDVGFSFTAPETTGSVGNKDLILNYTVKEVDGIDKFRFDGIAKLMGKAASGGRIGSIDFRILPIKQNVVVDNILLTARDFGPGQPIKLSKEFELPGGFDKLTFEWHIKYYF